MKLTKAQEAAIESLMEEWPKDDFTLYLERGHKRGDNIEVTRSWMLYGGDNSEGYTITGAGDLA